MKKTVFATALLLLATLNLSAALRRVPVIPVEFEDVPLLADSTFEDLLSRAEEYMNSQFYGHDSFEFILQKKVTLNPSQQWTNLSETVVAACQHSSKSGTDFSFFDCDGDSFVDNVCFIFAGDRFWPQHAHLSDSKLTLSLNRKHINSYSITLEGQDIGVFCHEYLHSLGLKDLYDTDGALSGGEAPGLWGSIGIMDKGDKNDSTRTPPCLCAPDLQMLGLGECDTLALGEWRLEPLNRRQRYLYFPGKAEGECFLFECRAEEGWDRYIGGHGMLIYHIDNSLGRAGYSSYYNITLTAYERWQRNQVNCRPDHQCADLVEADPDAQSIERVFFPLTGRSAFSGDTEPSFRFWDGQSSGIALTGIRLESDGAVEFKVIEPVKVLKTAAFQDAAILSWKLDETLLDGLDLTGISVYSGTKKIRSALTFPDSDGHCSILLEDLEPGTAFTVEYFAEVHGDRFTERGEFSTAVSDPRNDYPFIFLTGAERGEDGSFPYGSRIPLRVFNATDAKAVIWTFDGAPVTVEEDGYYTIRKSGLLRANVTRRDGSHDIIAKKITVR